jgi:hypothetical protein
LKWPQNGQVTKPPCRGRFWFENVPFSTKINTLEKRDGKVDDDVNRLYIYIFGFFSGVAMVADEGAASVGRFAQFTLF